MHWILFCITLILNLISLSEYVVEIYQTFLTSNKKELKEACLKIKEMTPAPINSMLGKQCVEEALKKRKEKKSMNLPDAYQH